MTDPDATRDPLEELAAEFTERQRRGECPSVSEYAEKHPELADDIRELFPAIVAMERLRAQKEQTGDGRASLGPLTPDHLGEFRIIREIGRGGMGVVYEAEHESLGRHMAVKVLPKQLLLDPKHLERFRREARIAANLHHTNIVEVFGVGEQDGLHYYVMQYVDGVGLDKVIAYLAQHGASGDAADEDADEVSKVARHLLPKGRVGPSYWRNVARIGRQVAEALSYAHEQGTLHRDIKPGNLLLDDRGSVWVTDFGLAKAIQSEDVTVTGDVGGTLRYMAPEQFSGKTDARSDIYSLGLTLYELLALRPAYEDTDRSRLIHRITQGEAARPRKLNAKIPRDLETIVLKATAREPERRYPSAGELARDLECFLEDRPIQARRATAVERLWRWCRRNPAIAALTGATMLLILLVAVVATAGYVRTKRALDGEARERQRAEATAQLAEEALGRIFDHLSPIGVRRGPSLTVEDAEGVSVEVPGPPPLSPKTAALLQEMLVFYDRLAQQVTYDETLLRRIAEANRRVGDIRQRLGQYDEAAAAYRKAIATYEDLNKRPGGGRFEVEIARIQNEVGRLCRSMQQAEESRRFHLKALAILESRTVDTPEARYELARTYCLLGARDRPLPGPQPRGQGHEARRRPKDRPRKGGPPAGPDDDSRYLARAIALLDELVAEYPSRPEYRHLLALCYRERFMELAPDDPAAAVSALKQSEAILEDLAQDFPDAPDYRYELCETYTEPDIRRPLLPGYGQEAIEQRLRKALSISEGLVAEHPHVPQYAAAQAYICHKLGDVLRQVSKLDEAEQSHRQAVALQRSLADQFPQVPYYRVWLGAFRNSLADLLARHGRPQEARPMFEETIAMLEELLKQDSSMWYIHGILAKSNRDLAEALRRCGEKELASKADRQSEKHQRELRNGPYETQPGPTVQGR